MDNIQKNYIKEQLHKAIAATEAGELIELTELLTELNDFITIFKN